MESDVEEGFTRRFWTHSELAEGFYLSRSHLYRLIDEGAMLPPDVWLPPSSYGWDPDRARRFGVATKRLSADDYTQAGPTEDGSVSEAQWLVQHKYNRAPQLYVSSWYASFMYGNKRDAVYFARMRDNFIPADVLLGAKKFGWSEPRVIEFGLQTGRMEPPDVDRWVVRRTAEFKLPRSTPWVREHLARVQEAHEAAGREGLAPLLREVERAANAA